MLIPCDTQSGKHCKVVLDRAKYFSHGEYDGGMNAHSRIRSMLNIEFTFPVFNKFVNLNVFIQ